MARRPSFGGDWTDEKLERVRKYLKAYVTIFHGNVRARFFRTSYVDAFAGAGYRVEQDAKMSEPSFAELVEPDATAFCTGSARVALEVDPPFDRYVFIDRDRRSTVHLDALKDEFPDKADRVEVHRAEANEFVRSWCRSVDPQHDRAVMFLDPYGMQVEWATIEAIARTRTVDLSRRPTPTRLS